MPRLAIALSALALTLSLTLSASAQNQNVGELLRRNQTLQEENIRLKAQVDQLTRRNEALRRDALEKGVKAVAVIDVVKAFNALIEKTEFDADFKGQGTDAIQEDKKRRERIKKLQDQLDQEVIGTKGYNDKQKEVDDAVLDHQLWLAGEQGKLLAQRNRRMEEIYNKMMTSIGDVAKELKFDQVMIKEPTLNLIGARPDQVAAMIRSRKVLWSHDRLEITDQVVKRMNDDFVKGKGAGE